MPGHFSTLVKQADGQVWILDLSADEPLREISQAEFLEAWDGVVICPAGTWLKMSSALGLLAIAGLASCLIVNRWWSRRHGRRSHENASIESSIMTACLLASVSVMGCGRSVTTEVSSPPAIRFTSPSINVGVVREAGERVVTYPFEVIARASCKITEVVPCCGGRLVETDLIGAELAPGSKHSLKLAWVVSDDPFPRTLLARIATDPPSSSPLAVALHFQFVGPPRLSRTRLSFDASSTSGGGTKLEAYHWRRTGAAPLTLLMDQSRSSQVTVQEANQSTEIVERDGGRMALDTTRIRLAANGGLPPGTRRDTLPLVWSNRTRQDVELTIQVVTPVRAEPESIFFGYLSPGEMKVVSVTLRDTDAPVFEVVSAESKDRSISTEYDADGHRLLAKIVAPSTAGRIQSEIRIAFRPQTIPELTIPVSAIIRGEHRDRTASDR